MDRRPSSFHTGPDASLRIKEWEPLPDSVAEVRQFIRSELADLPRNLRGRIELLASELATNAVLHAATPFRVVIQAERDAIRVSVIDRGFGEPRMSRPSGTDLHGRGLYMVDLLSSEWGVNQSTRGTSVWFRIKTTG